MLGVWDKNQMTLLLDQLMDGFETDSDTDPDTEDLGDRLRRVGIRRLQGR